MEHRLARAFLIAHSWTFFGLGVYEDSVIVLTYKRRKKMDCFIVYVTNTPEEYIFYL